MKIHGIPVSPNEDVCCVMEDIAKSVNKHNNQHLNTNTVHRIPVNKNAIMPIIIRFKSRLTKCNCFNKYKNLQKQLKNTTESTSPK